MGWRDAPLVESKGGWRDAPLVDAPEQPSGYAQSHVGQAVYGVNEGIGNALGAPVDLINAGLSVIGMGSDKPFLGSRMINEMMSGAGAIKEGTDDPSKQVVRRIGQTVGETLPFGLGAASKAKTAVDAGKVVVGSLASAIPGGAAAAASQQLLPGNETAEALAEIAGSLTPMTVSAMLRRGKAALAAPSVQDLEAQAGKLYEQAENSGVTFDQPTVKAKVDDITARAINEGIDPTLHPGATAALKRLQDASASGLTVKEARTLRRVIAAAEKEWQNVDQQRVAGIMRRQFDELLNTVPELAPANALYQRAAKGDLIDQAIELAGARAGQFTGSGFENALRTEFRALDRRIIRGDLKGLSDAEVTAIRRVARGGPLENILRGIGKAAPTGPMSFGLSGGVPFFVGNAVGGPGAGAAAAGATMTAGMGGRAAATALQRRNAAIASALARRGGSARQMPLFSDEQSLVAKAILARQAATSQSQQ